MNEHVGFKAKFPGTCAKCGLAIEPGQAIKWTARIREHVACNSRVDHVRHVENYVNGYRCGTGLVLTYGHKAVIRATDNGNATVNGSREYTAGMVDAALALAQVGVK